MLNHLIRFSLHNRLLVLCMALLTMIGGSIVGRSLPIDVLPDLTRPRVTIITEAKGFSPEEVEQLISFPLEAAINGASGVMTVRSSSDIGLSVIYVDFDWGQDIYVARQIVTERIATVRDQLPNDVTPSLGSISSLLGQIMLIGMWSENSFTDPLEVRTLADWVVSQRLRTIPGVSQVITMGGGRKQFHVLVDQHKMHQFEVDLHEIETALAQSSQNVGGGYVDRKSQELTIRGMGRLHSADDIRQVVVKTSKSNRPVLVRDIASVRSAAQTKRGDASVNGNAAVVLTITKQPGADTRHLTREINVALAELKDSLPEDIHIETTYSQREFIDFAITNVVHALRDGAILVVIILFLFLFNFRTTSITLVAIPMSLVTTALVFRLMGLSINVMTLGGIAVALGELVDDAIVDVENIFRRLGQNAKRAQPKPAIQVVYNASMEVRNAIIISTVLVIVVFAPLFALSGIEGRLFKPLGVAYIVSILASTLVSLTVIPVLSYYLLPNAKATHRGDGAVVRTLKRLATPLIRLSLSPTGLTTFLFGTVSATVGALMLLLTMGMDFIPKFDEGAAQVNLFSSPGTSLETSTRIRTIADQKLALLLKTPENPNGPLLWFTAKTGRAENDEHIMGVNTTEYVITLNRDTSMTREEIYVALHHAVDEIPGVQNEVEQPIWHLISHMLSGVEAEIAIKIYGDDLNQLRKKAEEIKTAIADVPGITTPIVEQQQTLPQYRVEVVRERLAYYGITSQFINEFIEVALQGRIVTRLVENQRLFEVVLRLDDPYRNDLTNLHRMPLELPSGQRIMLSDVAHVYQGGGPNTINREQSRRRITVRLNAHDGDLGGVVADIRGRINEKIEMPEGYFVEYGGQFEAQQSANRMILWLSLLALVAVVIILYSAYPSASIVAQILIVLPAAFVGGVAALWLTKQSLTTSATVGFISLGGIAARNGLLLVSTYLDRIRVDGLTQETILAGSLERLAPVLMTALTTGLGLVPLVIGGHQPGKELLFPVATVILGGLITSTLCELFLRPGLFFHFSTNAITKLNEDARDLI